MTLPVLPIGCDAGRIARLFDFGVIPADSETKNHCLNTYEDQSCNDNFNRTQFEIDFFEKCGNQRECELTGLDTYFTSAKTAKCSKGTATFFAQWSCEFPNEERQQRKLVGLLISCIGVFIALFYTVYVDYIKCVAKTNFIDWDVKTITAADYTVEMTIQDEMYEKFCSDVYEVNCGVSKAQAFKQ